jgi:hypothetical protein
VIHKNSTETSGVTRTEGPPVNRGAAVASATAINRQHCSRGERPIKFLGSMFELFVISSPPVVAVLFDSISHFRVPSGPRVVSRQSLEKNGLGRVLREKPVRKT